MAQVPCDPRYETGCFYEGVSESWFKESEPPPTEAPPPELPSVYDNQGLLSREPWSPSANIGFDGFSGFQRGILNTGTEMPVNTFSYEQKPFSHTRKPFSFDKTPFQYSEETPFNFDRFNTYNRG